MKLSEIRDVKQVCISCLFNYAIHDYSCYSYYKYM